MHMSQDRYNTQLLTINTVRQCLIVTATLFVVSRSHTNHFVVDLVEVDLAHFFNHIFVLKGNKSKACVTGKGEVYLKIYMVLYY